MTATGRAFRLLAAVLVTVSSAAAEEPKPQRIVFLGDSITDGNTLAELVHQAFADAGETPPVCINAGVGGDTAAQMLNRLDRDVLPRRPDLVVLSAGINDVLHKVDPADYERDVTAIAERLKKEKIGLLILTTTVLGPKHEAEDKKLADFNAALRRVAEKYGAKVTEVNSTMARARADGQNLMEADQVHLNFAGYRLMARAVLDALGHPKVAVPEKLKLEPMPGLVREWRVKAFTDKPPALTEEAVAALAPDNSWKPYTLPEKESVPAWWLDDERKRGFAVSLPALVGPAKEYRAVAVAEAKKAGKVFFNTGSQLESVWLNGKRIYHNEGWTGWHAGKQRVPAELREGRNTVVIETDGPFFLSVTDNADW
jgi:lysophospholipase L1-like esterase